MAKIHLPNNDGRYTNDDANKLIKSMRKVLESIFKPGKYGPGMEGLFNLGAISKIKPTDFMMTSIILADAAATS